MIHWWHFKHNKINNISNRTKIFQQLQYSLETADKRYLWSFNWFVSSNGRYWMRINTYKLHMNKRRCGHNDTNDNKNIYCQYNIKSSLMNMCLHNKFSSLSPSSKKRSEFIWTDTYTQRSVFKTKIGNVPVEFLLRWYRIKGICYYWFL